MENNALILANEAVTGRPKKALKPLPRYTRGEEIFNMVSHILGAAMGFVILIMCVASAASNGSTAGVTSSIIFGMTVIALYTMSAVYHGIKKEGAKRVMQVIDHCTIYLLIAGTYTPILLMGIKDASSSMAVTYLAVEWTLAAGAVALTAVDMHKFKALSMVLYLLLGWGIIFFSPMLIAAVGINCFILILSGGVAYTVGSVLYGLGRKIKYMHSIFHIFCIAGTLLHFLAVYLYCL